MAFQNDNVPSWLIQNGWREILARIFNGFEPKLNISPEWLINPATKRHLKLDLLYPDIGVAVRFENAEVKQRRRRASLQEEEQQQTRDYARVEVCRAHSIDLIVVDLAAEQPKITFQEIDIALSRAKQRLQDPALLQKITQARATAANLSRQAASYNNFKLYADLWQDRQYQVTPAKSASSPSPTIAFSPGMEVEHPTFGPGVIIAATPSGNDTLLTVDFITAGPKTLAASLVGDKLRRC
ncbi:MAG: hypothetical protein U0401_27100 [Anaerolineae bacterium]